MHFPYTVYKYKKRIQKSILEILLYWRIIIIWSAMMILQSHCKRCKQSFLLFYYWLLQQLNSPRICAILHIIPNVVSKDLIRRSGQVIRFLIDTSKNTSIICWQKPKDRHFTGWICARLLHKIKNCCLCYFAWIPSPIPIQVFIEKYCSERKN